MWEVGAIKAEVVYAIRYEMAATIEDILARRLGMQFYAWQDCIDAAPLVGSLMAKELQWAEPFARESINNYVEKINHLMDSAGLSRKDSCPSVSRVAADRDTRPDVSI